MIYLEYDIRENYDITELSHTCNEFTSSNIGPALTDERIVSAD